MNAVKAWSYSRFALYEQCPLAFKLKFLDKIPEEGSPAMERGNVIHKALAAYITGTGELPDVVKNPFQKQLYAQMRAIPAEDKLVEQQMGFTKEWKPTGWFSKDTYARVIWDAAFLYEDLTGEVGDHKTGKKYGSNADQMELFGLSFLAQYLPATHVTTRLIYVDAGEEEIAEFPASDKEPLIAKWSQKIIPMFSDTIFAPRPNDKCKFCAFSRSNKGLCKFG